jgi:hypothetical protein
MLAFDALVRGRVTVEVAGGPPARIPTGHCRVETHEGFVRVSWPDENCTRSATMRFSQFEKWLEAGGVVVLDAAQLAHPRLPVRI